MKKAHTGGVLASVAILGFCLLPFAGCQKSPSPEPAHPEQATTGRATITFLSGEVSTKTTGEWQPAEIGSLLVQEASLKTGGDSLCELQMGSTAIVRIDENSVVALNRLSLAPGKSQVGISAVAGTLVCKVNAMAAGERFQVSTPSAVCGVRGTEFVVTITAGKTLLLGVKKGKVAVLPPWADFQELRSELKEKEDVLAPLIDQVNEGARVVADNQQIVVGQSTVQAWQKAFAPIEERINTLSARAKKGEEITREAVAEISTSLEPLESSLAKPLQSSTVLSSETTAVLSQTSTMLFKELPSAVPSSSAPTPESAALAAVTVTAQPTDAEITMNGVLVGQGRCTGLFAVGEKVTFLARRDGYVDTTLVITVEKGAPKTYAMELDKAKEEKEGRRPLVRRFSLSHKAIVGHVSLAEGKVVAADAAGTLYAASVKGHAAWKLPTQNAPNETSAPVVMGSRLYFTGGSEFIIAEVSDGAISHRGDLDSSSVHQFGQRVARLDTSMIFPTASGVRIIDAGTGATTLEIPVPGGSMMTPAVWGGRIVTVSKTGILLIIDPSSGEILSKISTKAIQPVGGAVQIREDTGYFADRKGLVVCVDLAAAKVLWQAPLIDRQSAGVFQDLECGSEGVFAHAKGTLYALSLSKGETLFPPVAGVSCPPLLHDGRLYYGTEEGALRVADAASGQVLGSLELRAKISVRPEWQDGILFLGTAGGEIIEVDPSAIP